MSESLFSLGELHAIDAALDDLAALVLVYERRLIFKGRERNRARMAAAGLGHAKGLLARARNDVRGVGRA